MRDHVSLLTYGVEAITGMSGALFTGSGYLALDTDFAQDRLTFMAKYVGSEVLQTHCHER